jgi:hypothetical protein
VKHTSPSIMWKQASTKLLLNNIHHQHHPFNNIHFEHFPFIMWPQFFLLCLSPI